MRTHKNKKVFYSKPKKNKNSIKSKKLNTHENKNTTFKGKVQASGRGFAFIIPDDKEKFNHDFFVPQSSLNGAIDGDRVTAMHISGTKDEAKVLSIIEHTRHSIAGTYSRGHVLPDNSKLPEVIIPYSLSLSAKNGDKVLCEITSYSTTGKPKGKIKEIPGESGDFYAEELSIIRSFELYENFSDEVLQEADNVASQPILLNDRVDLRNKTIFTIDGADTRDIDDAVSLEIDGDNYILGVHIADVSNYVKLRSKIDESGYARGTSVYFPDRVFPMLPKILSNGVCSLNEGEDRYTLSCVMTFNSDGKKIKSEIFKSMIRSCHKTTYNQINDIIQGNNEIVKKYSDIVDTVLLMHKLCLILERNRRANGEVELDVKESKIYIDESGEIIIPNCKRLVSERIIEQFMVSANESVAEFLESKSAPCLYRIHESPSPEKAEMFMLFLNSLGINANFDTKNIFPLDYKKILDSIKEKPFATTVNRIMLRSMQKARYQEKNVGHFGLASKCYCHFTSPIRRYPDLFVHRVIKEILSGKPTTKFIELAKAAGKDCSEKERIAIEAERAVTDFYKAVYMSNRIGEEYEAVISGVTNFGLFCELENSIEGLIPIETLKEEYEFIEDKFMLKSTKRTFKLGDKLKIRVEDPDFSRMRVIFSIVV